jgi:hypothetical protein
LIVKDELALPVGGIVMTDPQPRNQIVGANMRGERAFALDTVCLLDYPPAPGLVFISLT